MSASLVKKALLLDSQDHLDMAAENEKQENMKDAKKEKPKLKRKHRDNRIIKTKKNKTLEDDYKKYQERDNTGANLVMISRLSDLDDSEPQLVKKIVQHKEQRSRQNPKKEKSQPSQQSIFSDRDFDQFEKEYDFDFWGK